MAIDLHAYLTQNFQWKLRNLTKDIRAFAPGKLGLSPGGVARSAADIVYELILDNRIWAKDLRGEEAGESPGFLPCPPDWIDADRLCAELTAGIEEIQAALGEDLEREIIVFGSPWTIFACADFIQFHLDYHLGQLNLLHTLYGDTKTHWGDE